jgi:hypothetical protein
MHRDCGSAWPISMASLTQREGDAASETESADQGALAIVVSQSTGTVRLFQAGEIIRGIAPMRHTRVMKWTDAEVEPPTGPRMGCWPAMLVPCPVLFVMQQSSSVPCRLPGKDDGREAGCAAGPRGHPGRPRRQ